MTATTTTKEYYIIETSGNERYVWGPHADLYAAKKHAGVRHFVASGDGLRNGQKILTEALRTSVRIGSVKIEDGASLDGI